MKRYLFIVILLFLAVTIWAQVRIDTPVLVSPTNNKTNQMPDVILDWNAVTAAYQYQVQLSEDAAFTTMIVDSITDLTSIKNNRLKFNFQYYWRVKAIDVNLNESFWTPVWSFTTFNKLELDKPNNNATDQTANVVLKWKKSVTNPNSTVSGIEIFDIEIDTLANFTSPVVQLFSVNGQTYEKVMSELYFGTKYYWHVRARHATDISSWSDSRTFTVLNQFDLKKPDNNSVNTDLNVQLRWDDVSGFRKYDYEVSHEPDFSSADYYTTDTFRVVAQELMYGVKYYWRCRGRHNHDTTSWSAVWNFTTAGSVVPSAPLNGEDSISLKPQLKWSQIKGTNKYQVQYDMDGTFTDPENYFQDASDTQSPFFNVLYALSAGTTYYWRVRACTEIDTSAYSDVWSFTTLPAQGIHDDYFKQADINMYPNPAKTDLTIEFNLKEPALIEFSVIDLVGQVLINEKYTSSAGLNTRRIDLTGLANGIYLMKMLKDDSVYTNKLIINK